jgi:hypothetical protein
MNTIHICTRQEVIAAYMPTEKRSKEANILIFREIPEKTGGKIRRAFAWEDKFKRLLLRFEHLQQRHFAMKLLAYTLINMRKFCGV